MTLFHTCCETLHHSGGGGMKVNERTHVCPPNRGERSTRMLRIVSTNSGKIWAFKAPAYQLIILKVQASTSTNACTSSLHHTSCHCSLQWWLSQPVDICGPLISAIYSHTEDENCGLRPSKFFGCWPITQHGIVCRRNSRTRHWQPGSSFASLRLICLYASCTAVISA